MDTVSNFEVERYLGEWYQVAAIPAWFQKKCAKNTKANYTLTKSGLLKVINSCVQADEKLRTAEARARFTAPQNLGKLEVTFVNIWGHWLWAAAGDYWVIGLDPKYTWSVVGTSDRKYAWVLSRTPELPAKEIAKARQYLDDAGFDTCKVLMTTPNLSNSLCTHKNIFD